MEDYKFYKAANEEIAWKALHAKMIKNNPEQTETKVIYGHFNHKKKFIRNLIAVAAVFIGVVGIGLWFILPGNSPLIYQTAYNVQKKVTMADGSVITLQPGTRIEVPAGYNKSGRTVIMAAGEAWFDVIHSPGKSFVVELGTTQIRDIGTSFTIRKELTSIDVFVSAGKIAFVKLSTRETKELNAGAAITYDVERESFGDVRAADQIKINEQLLNFENTPLSEVIVSVQKIYGKKIIINGDIAHKTFTGQLEGMPYNRALMVICESLGLEFTSNDSIFILRAKATEQP
jgi:ferric-dicitrate binding protein FerR (iron transport regulator)